MGLAAFNRMRRQRAAVTTTTPLSPVTGHAVPIDTVFPKSLAEMDSKELKALAKEKDLKGYSRKTDEELIEMLRAELSDGDATSNE